MIDGKQWQNWDDAQSRVATCTSQKVEMPGPGHGRRGRAEPAEVGCDVGVTRSRNCLLKYWHIAFKSDTLSGGSTFNRCILCLRETSSRNRIAWRRRRRNLVWFLHNRLQERFKLSTCPLLCPCQRNFITPVLRERCNRAYLQPRFFVSCKPSLFS